MRLVGRLVGCALALMMHSSAAGQDLTPIGAFGNVRESLVTGEPHCYGYSLDLWRYRGQILGLLRRHNGLCGDPPCESPVNVSRDTRTGRISFSALGVMFVGTVRRDDVIGTIDGKPVRLTREMDDLVGMDSARDKSLDEWCHFWRGVPRCRGVDQLCSSLGSPKR
jgi:hypothetical protein